MAKSLVILGSGGHAAVLIDILIQQQREVLAIVSPEFPHSKVFNGISHFSSDDDVLNFDKDSIKLINGIGSLPGSKLRKDIYERFTRLGYKFEAVLSPGARVSSYAEIGAGVQVMAGAIVQTGATVGDNSIINTGATVDHDCKIGMNNHIAPGVTLSGQVHTKEFVHIGTGASIIQGINIARNVVVGAGAIITKNVEVEGTICFPARSINKVIE